MFSGRLAKRTLTKSALAGFLLVGTSLLAAQAADPVRIGFSVSRTGLFASAAPTQTNGYELWKDQVNADGGLSVDGVKRPVEFVTYDDQSSPTVAARIYEKLINDDRPAFLKFAKGLHDAALPALRATEERNPAALLDAGEAIDTACENCHLKYWYPLSEQAQKAKEGAGSPRKP